MSLTRVKDGWIHEEPPQGPLVVPGPDHWFISKLYACLNVLRLTTVILFNKNTNLRVHTAVPQNLDSAIVVYFDDAFQREWNGLLPFTVSSKTWQKSGAYGQNSSLVWRHTKDQLKAKMWGQIKCKDPSSISLGSHHGMPETYIKKWLNKDP